MTDLLTYTEDLPALLAEVEATYPDFIQEGKIIGLDKTPTIKNGIKSIALVRNPPSELTTLDNLTVLGTYDEVFADPSLKAIYDSVYVREYEYEDENGNTVTGMRPEKFGVFT